MFGHSAYVTPRIRGTLFVHTRPGALVAWDGVCVACVGRASFTLQCGVNVARVRV